MESLPDDIGLDLAANDIDGVPLDTGLGTTAMRIAMSINSEDELGLSKMRWMTAGGVGTFLELTATETDFFALISLWT